MSFDFEGKKECHTKRKASDVAWVIFLFDMMNCPEMKLNTYTQIDIGSNPVRCDFFLK